jgi:hypothetical protein
VISTIECVTKGLWSFFRDSILVYGLFCFVSCYQFYFFQVPLAVMTYLFSFSHFLSSYSSRIVSIL